MKCAASWCRIVPAFAAVVLTIAAPHTFAADETAAVATVNGDAVTQREFVEALRRSRARFADPTALRQAALDDCVRFKVLQQLAREQHLLTDTSDAVPRNTFAQENDRRAQATAHGEVVYGPTQLPWEAFRLTWRDRIQRDLTRLLAERAGPESEAALRSFYTAHPAKFTAPGAAAPMPFEELKDHVLAEYRSDKFADIFRRTLTAADVRPKAERIAALEPNTPLEDHVVQ
jgi:hypothetical protein